MKIPVTPGAHYTIGMPRPMLVTDSMIVSSAGDSGFRNVRVSPRASAHLNFDPRQLPGYDDDWDTVVVADYAGTDTLIEAPGSPSWLIEEKAALPPRSTDPASPSPPAVPAVVTTTSSAPSSNGEIAVWVVAGVMAGIFTMWSWRKS